MKTLELNRLILPVIVHWRFLAERPTICWSQLPFCGNRWFVNILRNSFSVSHLKVPLFGSHL